MIDAAHGNCFTVTGKGYTSLRDLLTGPQEGISFEGPTPFLEATQLMIAAGIVADYLTADDAGEDLDTVADRVLGRMDARPGRHRLDGDGPRYLQVRLDDEACEEKDVAGLDGELFPNFGMMSKGDSEFNFGIRPHTSRDGFCPSCALIGLNFVAKFSGGTGGKVSGPWKHGLLTFPIFRSLRDTILVNALAWRKVKLPQTQDVGVDPWADNTYTSEVAKSGTFREEFKTVPHLRALTPWAVWLKWEVRHGTCSLCGKETGHLAVGVRAPVKDQGKYTGKLGWPKTVNAKGKSVSDCIPSPYTPVDMDKGEIKSRPATRDELLSVADSILYGSEAAPALSVIDEEQTIEDGRGYSVLVAGIFNDHKGVGSYAYVTHIPVKSDLYSLSAQCARLQSDFEQQGGNLRKGLGAARSLRKSVKEPKISGDIAYDLWKEIAGEFIRYLEIEQRAAWQAHLKSEALRLYDQATQWAYETTKEFDGFPVAKLAAWGRSTVNRNESIKEKK